MNYHDARSPERQKRTHIYLPPISQGNIHKYVLIFRAQNTLRYNRVLLYHCKATYCA